MNYSVQIFVEWLLLNLLILKFLVLHKFLLERKHLQFFAKLFAVLIAALTIFPCLPLTCKDTVWSRALHWGELACGHGGSAPSPRPH